MTDIEVNDIVKLAAELGLEPHEYIAACEYEERRRQRAERNGSEGAVLEEEVRDARWQAEETLEADFEAACTAVSLVANDMKNEDALCFYGLYKQATSGDVPDGAEEKATLASMASDFLMSSFTSASPAAMRSKLKRQAWLKYKGMSSEEAKVRYIEKVMLRSGDEDFVLPSGINSATGDVSESTFGTGGQRSCHLFSRHAGEDHDTLVRGHSDDAEEKGGDYVRDGESIVGPDSSLRSNLHNAALDGDVELARRIVDTIRNREDDHVGGDTDNSETPVSVDDRDEDGANALMLAADQNNLAILNLLLSSGSKVDAVDNCGMTSMHYAAFSGHIDALHLLLAKGGSADIEDNDGQTPRQILPEAFSTA